MAYIGQVPVPQSTERRVEITATSGQTSFTGLTYVENFLDVFLNGVKLASSDFTATDGTSCTLASGAASGDIVAFVSRTQTSALVALPLKDSTGANVLSESGGTVTLAHDIIDGNSSYGFAQLQLTSGQSMGNIVWDTISGDTTNITKPNSDHDIRLAIAGIYSISVSATFVLSGEERAITITLLNASDDTVYTFATDSLKQADSNATYGNAASNYVGYFPANSEIYFSASSSSGGNATLQTATHASIVLLRRTT